MRVAELLMRLMMQIGVLLLEATYTAAQPWVKHPGCQERCGNVSIPYPFGTTKGCYLDEEFHITCNDTFHPPTPFLRDGNIDVTDISIEGKLRIMQFVAYDCYNESGAPDGNSQPLLSLSKFSISDTDNKFIAVGCDTKASITGFIGKKLTYKTECISICYNIDDVANYLCSGIGCCQTSIPKGIDYFNIVVESYFNHTDVWDFNPCSYAFVVEESSYNFSSRDLSTYLQEVEQLPVVLDWSIGNETCQVLQQKNIITACQGNSTCSNPENGPGYRCKCNEGYRGNPYLGCLDIDECKDPKLNKCMNIKTCSNTEGNYMCTCPIGFRGDGKNGGDGCKDINECEDPNLNKCVHNTTCNNTDGNYKCSCPKGYDGDGKKDGDRCISKLLKVIEITAGVCVATMVLLMGISWFYMSDKKQKLISLKKEFFKENKKKFFDQKGGSKIFQQLKSDQERTTETTNIFTVEELEKATKNYDESRIVGKGGYGTFYKGDLTDGRTVTIKKSERVHVDQIEQVINEIIVLSRISHENVVKLLGCCLETEVPLLVYEFITNGTLFDHIHKSKASSIAWKFRLKIAVETARVLSYLHSLDKDPIIHRDVKSANILLDNSFTAKVYHFGATRLAPLDHAELSTVVQGTLGYLDPEYLQTSQLTDKSDVYSFGVILVELLTGKMALSLDKPENKRNLSMYFLLAMKDGRLKEILDHCVVDKMTVCNKVADIAMKCLEMQGEKRPSMKKVAEDLEDLVKHGETS